MKFNYKKIASVFASAVMLSSTIGFAAAAAYPAPFVKSGAADVAIVYGSAAAASVDMTNAVDIVKGDLDKKVTVTTTTITGENYQIKKQSTAFQLGRGIKDVISGTITDDDLPTLLKDGIFVDDDNDEFKYTQKLVMANLTYGMFEDDDYKVDTPALGIRVASNANVFNYTLDFTSYPVWGDLPTAEIEILGKSYYILSNTTTSLTLLDSADKVIVSEGESATVTLGSKVYTIKIGNIDATTVKLDIDGVVTNSLQEGETSKLKDGSFVGVRDIMYNSKDTGISKVEFSIGSGKLKLINNSDIELNDVSVSGLSSLLGLTDGKMNQIKLIWKVDDDSFAADGSEIVIPGFKSIKLSYTGMTTPKKEEIKVKNSGNYVMELNNFPLKDSSETIPLLYGDSNGYFLGFGKSATQRLNTGTNATTVFWVGNSADEYAILSWSDGRDAESYLLRADSWKNDSGTHRVTISYRKNSAWVEAKKDAANGDTITIGNAEMMVSNIEPVVKNATFTATGTSGWRTLYSKDGLRVWLPWNATAAQCNVTAATALAGAINLTTGGPESAFLGHSNYSFDLLFTEEDKNENKGAGGNFTSRISWTSTPRIQVSTITVNGTGIAGTASSNIETGSSTNVYRNYVYSALATKYEYDQGGDQDIVTFTYNGGESYGNFFLTASSATAGGDSSIKVFKDTDTASFKDMNLVVVGGSCVNQVAVQLLGGTDVMCGDAFTAATTVGAGKYLIKTFTSPYNAAKVATLVAGYNAEDTKAALSKLITGVDTEVGKQEIGPALS